MNTYKVQVIIRENNKSKYYDVYKKMTGNVPSNKSLYNEPEDV